MKIYGSLKYLDRGTDKTINLFFLVNCSMGEYRTLYNYLISIVGIVKDFKWDSTQGFQIVYRDNLDAFLQILKIDIYRVPRIYDFSISDSRMRILHKSEMEKAKFLDLKSIDFMHVLL